MIGLKHVQMKKKILELYLIAGILLYVLIIELNK